MIDDIAKSTVSCYLLICRTVELLNCAMMGLRELFLGGWRCTLVEGSDFIPAALSISRPVIPTK